MDFLLELLEGRQGLTCEIGSWGSVVFHAFEVFDRIGCVGFLLIDDALELLELSFYFLNHLCFERLHSPNVGLEVFAGLDRVTDCDQHVFEGRDLFGAGLAQGLAFLAVSAYLFEVAVVAEGYVVGCGDEDSQFVVVGAGLNLWQRLVF